jgi:hypothetical protein
MTMAEAITLEDIMVAIAQCNPAQGKIGIAVADIVAATGKGENRVRAELRRAIAAGTIEYAGNESRVSSDQKMRPVPVYRPVAARDTSAKRVAGRKK